MGFMFPHRMRGLRMRLKVSGFDFGWLVLIRVPGWLISGGLRFEAFSGHIPA